MAIGNIAAGSTGQFGLSITLGGKPYAPNGPIQITWSSNDVSVTFAAATEDASNGAIPLDQQIVASVPGTDQGTSLQVVASVFMNGQTYNVVGTAIALTPQALQFSIVDLA